MDENPYRAPQCDEPRAPAPPRNRRVSPRLQEMRERNAQRNLYAGFMVLSILAAVVYFMVRWYWR